MEARDLASNLEFWSGRARNGVAGEDPGRRPRPYRGSSLRRRAPRGRARPVAAAALLVGLTAAWLVAGHQSHPSAALDARPLPAASSTVAPTTVVPRTPGCRGLTPAKREVRCVIDRIDLDVRLFDLATVADAYGHATGAFAVARSGLPACADGVPDERAWSLAAAPDAAVGRYWCGFERDHAAMWWTRRDRLFHAVAPAGDLAGLFSWWRTHPSE